MFGLITISLMTGMIVFVSECYDLPAEESETYFNQWNCPDKQYNALATLFFNTEAGTIRSLFSENSEYTITSTNLAIFTSVWYLMTILTYGVWIPAGLFLPGIIVGGAMGRLYT